MSRTVTFSEIDREMERREAIEKLREVLQWMLSKGHTKMPSSLDSWKIYIKDFDEAHSKEWKDAFLVPGPGGDMIKIDPPIVKKKVTAIAYEYVHPVSDDTLLDLIVSSDEEEDD